PLSRGGQSMGDGLGMTQSLFDPLLTSSHRRSRSSGRLPSSLRAQAHLLIPYHQRVEEGQQAEWARRREVLRAPVSSTSQVCRRRLRLRHLRAQ
ncbi:hypothetical protein PMAYCL1PPCAC_11376, partial [Pristionchus mayeri]